MRDSGSGRYFADINSSFRLESNGSLTVRLTNLANEYVIADAVRIERISTVAPAPEIQVLDGSSNIVDGGMLDFGPTTPGNAVTKTLTVRNTGSQTLSLTPLNGASFPAGFSLVQNFTRTSLAPNQTTTFGIRFSSATNGIRSGAVSFANNDSDENPFNLQLRGTVATPPPTPVVQILDNGESGYSQTGFSYFPAGYGGDTNYVAGGTGSAAATWTFNNLQAGVYRISATWDHGI